MMHTGLKRHSWASILMGVAIVAVWLSLAWDGRLHWDEPSCLYMGAYLNGGEILAGEFEPSRIAGFNVQRIGHILLLHLITALTGPGIAVLWLVIGCYLLLLIAFVGVTYLILRLLTPSVYGRGAAVGLLAFSPLYVYLAFKTLPEIPAVLMASVSVVTLQWSLSGRPVIGLTMAALALLATGLCRPLMGLMFLSFVVALVLCYRSQFPPSKVISYALIAGLVSLALFFLSLWAMGVPVQVYLGFVRSLANEIEPVESKIFHTALEGGLLFMALPVAFVSTQRRAAVFYGVWFVLATVPLLTLFPSIEARYLAPNLPALAGLISLSIDGLAPRVRRWLRHRKTATITISCATAAALIATAALAQPVMHHGLHMHQLSTLLGKLDAVYGYNNYVILTPEEFTTFHYLRFAYPGRKVYTVHRRRDQHTGQIDPYWPALQQRFYGPRAILTLDQLTALDDELIYVGFSKVFPVANLRAMVRWLSWTPLPQFMNRKLDKMELLNHLAASWMWNHSQLRFSEVARSGYYIAMRVETASPVK
jgi:hypothetical protein